MHPRNPAHQGEGPRASLIFPTYNPGAVLETTWRAVDRFLKNEADWEAVFVCDGCTDDSAARLTELSRQTADRVRIISYAPNRGKGFAIRAGLAAARGTHRIFTDIDLAYGFDDVLRLDKALSAGADVAIASRVHSDSRLFLPANLQGYVYRRHLQSVVFSRIVRWILPLTQADTQAGLKGMRAHVAERLLPSLRCDGFEFDCELLTACVRNGLNVAEVPVCVRYSDQASTTRLSGVGRMVRELFRIRRAWPAADPSQGRAPERRPAAPDRKAA